MKVWAVAICIGIAACEGSTAGDDPKGQELKAQASPVLLALIAYEKDNGSWPTAFSQLVPKYIRERPAEPALAFSDFSSDISFRYKPAGAAREIECVADFGDTEWSCHELM